MNFRKIRLMRVTFAVVNDVKQQFHRLNVFSQKKDPENKTIVITYLCWYPKSILAHSPPSPETPTTLPGRVIIQLPGFTQATHGEVHCGLRFEWVWPRDFVQRLPREKGHNRQVLYSSCSITLLPSLWVKKGTGHDRTTAPNNRLLTQR
jgi:hypothetical protein